MTVTFTNPQGRTNEAYLTSNQVEKLKGMEGYKVVEKLADPFSDDTPAISSKLTIHKADTEIGCAACSS